MKTKLVRETGHSANGGQQPHTNSAPRQTVLPGPGLAIELEDRLGGIQGEGLIS
jgi:hypothetical protein